MNESEKNAATELLQDESFPSGTPDELKELMQRAARREELHPDLVPWLEEGTVLGPFVKHPLVFMGVGNNGEMNAMANDAYEGKKAGLEKAMKERAWFAVIHVMYERPYRLYGFQKIEDELSDEEYWDILGGIWTDSENIWQNEQEWEEYLSSERPGRENLMDEDERKALSELPEEFDVWRGYCVNDREIGMAWTIDKDKAIWFAKRLAQEDRGDRPRLASARVRREDVIAYFTGRGESEVVVFPDDLIGLNPDSEEL